MQFHFLSSFYETKPQKPEHQARGVNSYHHPHKLCCAPYFQNWTCLVINDPVKLISISLNEGKDGLRVRALAHRICSSILFRVFMVHVSKTLFFS